MINENILKILEKDIRKGHMVDGEFEETEKKKLGEVIDPELDGYAKNGKFIINHTGVLKLQEYVGAEWVEIRLDDKPTSNNDKGFYYTVMCRFPDGEISYESGEANDRNTEGFSQHYKQSMAIIRGKNRSFLRSKYMKLYDVYSEEEAAAFDRREVIIDDLQKQVEENNKVMGNMRQEHTFLKGKHNTLVKTIINTLRLPVEDIKYPEELVKNVFLDHYDEEYMLELTGHEDRLVSYLATEMVNTYIPQHLKKMEVAKENEETELHDKEEKTESEGDINIPDDVTKGDVQNASELDGEE